MFRLGTKSPLFLRAYFLLFCFTGTIGATPDNDVISFPGYAFNDRSSYLRSFLGNSKRIRIFVDTAGIDVSAAERSGLRENVMNGLAYGNYIRFFETKDSTEPKRSRKNGAAAADSEKILAKFTFKRYEIAENSIGIGFEIELTNIKNRKRLSYEYAGSFPKNDPGALRNLLIEWKRDLFPAEDSFMIGEFLCFDPDRSIDTLLKRACSLLLRHDQDPGGAEFLLNRALKKAKTDRSSETIHNLLGYHFVSIGDLKNAEKFFVKAENLEDGEYKKYKHQIERIRELRERYPHYEKD
ncbi:hypothetical protein CH379_007210 [Leptospira ellisii]|uniref:Tetratricopeptide repeat protein n=1 Tax=Leptospira ellisii TaxID=2023197 RepID=A0A2N0B5T6_9LEPT|nr:hypothetical protein [Leptospira ellisii]MDV6235414.1 hypothetical protein [Leptospira ellisii]PJZ91905.1 hypothetical protein CH379_16115 [Leptospira ellisii]